MKAPTVPRGSDDETKAWKKQFDSVRNGMKGSNGIFAAAVKRIDALLDGKNERLNGIIQTELRGLALLLRLTRIVMKSLQQW